MDKEILMPCRSCKLCTDKTSVDSDGRVWLEWIKCEKNLIPEPRGEVSFSTYGGEGECKEYQHNEDAWW